MTFIFVFMHRDKAKCVYRKWNVAFPCSANKGEIYT